MGYFVTGATGFIGRFLVTNLLLKRKGPVHVLVRKDSMKKLEAIGRKMGWDMKRVVAVEGDMTRAKPEPVQVVKQRRDAALQAVRGCHAEPGDTQLAVVHDLGRHHHHLGGADVQADDQILVFLGHGVLGGLTG